MEMQSQDIGKLAEALAKAQGIIEDAAKDGSNPHFKSAYATLASVWNACRHALSSNGLSVIQMVETEADQMVFVTVLAHSSGQFIRSKMPLYPKDKTMQSVGSAISYARRYALSSMVGICSSDDDDDGEAAHGRPRQAPFTAPILSEETINKNFNDAFKDINSDDLYQFITSRPNPLESKRNALKDPEGFRTFMNQKKENSHKVEKK